MAISLATTSVVRSRRIRLFFSNTLAAGAFNTALYSVSRVDPLPLRAVYAVSGAPTACELVLGADMVDDTSYTITAVGVPAVDMSVTPGGTQGTIRFAFSKPLTNVEPQVSDHEVILYGRDIIWNGSDFQETGDGDLAEIAGAPNAIAALNRRFMGSPLPYAPGYSPNAREFVDSNTSYPLKNRISQQAKRDDRVSAVSVAVTANTDGYPIYIATVTLIGGQTSVPIPVTVQT